MINASSIVEATPIVASSSLNAGPPGPPGADGADGAPGPSQLWDGGPDPAEIDGQAAFLAAVGAVPEADLGVANGVATLGADGKVPGSQLPTGEAAAWGAITGTLSEQEDLQDALDGKQATLSAPGDVPGLSGALAAKVDWASLATKADNARQISTTAPLTGGGNLSADRVLSIPKATGSVDGYLSAVDWLAFTAKIDSTTLSALALGALANVQITSPEHGQTLTYDSTESIWVNSTPSGGGGGDYEPPIPMSDVSGLATALAAKADTSPFDHRPQAGEWYWASAKNNSIYLLSDIPANAAGGARPAWASQASTYRGYTRDGSSAKSRTCRMGSLTTTTTPAGFYLQNMPFQPSLWFAEMILVGAGEDSPISTARRFAGLGAISGAIANADPASLLNVLGICQLASDDTQWYGIHGDGSTTVTVATGIPVGDLVRLRMRRLPAAVAIELVSLTGGSAWIATWSSEIPSLATTLYARFWAGPSGAGGSSIGIDFSESRFEWLAG